MTKEEVPSVNPKFDAMCEMLKTIHGLNERNKTLEAKIEKMKCCGNCGKGNCVNIGQKGKACAYWTSNEIRR